MTFILKDVNILYYYYDYYCTYVLKKQRKDHSFFLSFFKGQRRGGEGIGYNSEEGR